MYLVLGNSYQRTIIADIGDGNKKQEISVQGMQHFPKKMMQKQTKKRIPNYRKYIALLGTMDVISKEQKKQQTEDVKKEKAMV